MDLQYAMMVTMETDATGHRTPDAGHLASGLRSSAPDTTVAGVPSPRPLPEATTGHRTPDTGRPAGPLPVRTGEPDGTLPDTAAVPPAGQPDTTTGRTPDTTSNRTPAGTAGNPSGWRPVRLLDPVRRAVAGRQERLRDSADAQRAARDASRLADETARDALVREAVAKRRRTVSTLLSEAEKIAPIPPWMLKASVWGDRVVGALLPTAPLLVSGFVTVQVGRDEPLNMGWMAVFLTMGLEGAVWYLNRLKEQFRLEGDGTFSIGAAVYGIVLLIACLIGGHAIWNHTGRMPIEITVPGTANRVPLDQLTPAIAIAVMSAIGTFIWSKKATYKDRAKLRAMGQIDPRAPKFAAGAWFTSPWETAWSLRHFFKYRIEGSAATVVADWRFWKATGKPSIWPVPAGFRYVKGKLVQLSLDELEAAGRREVLIATITGRDTEATGRPDTTPAITGRPDTGRRELPSGTPDTSDRTASTGRHGTPSGDSTGRPVPDDRTPDTGRHGTPDGGALPDGNGTPDGAHRTGALDGDRTPAGHGTPDANRTGEPDRQATADALKDSELIMIVAEAYPRWATQERVPSINEIITAINAHRAKDGGKFNSRDIAGRIRQSMIQFRKNPALLDLVGGLDGERSCTVVQKRTKTARRSGNARTGNEIDRGGDTHDGRGQRRRLRRRRPAAAA